ncbi:MAG: hypothetical protein ABH817_01775 [archaeon]
MKWRQNLDKTLRPFVEKLISESFKHEPEFRMSGDNSKAQLWVTAGILSRQLYNVEMKLRYLERALQDIAPKKFKTSEFLKAEAEVEKMIADIAGGKIVKPSKKAAKKKTSNKKSKTIASLKTNF